MLVLSRREGESIQIGDQIWIRVTKIRGGRVSIGVDAPTSLRVLRSELPASDQGQNAEALLRRIAEVVQQAAEPAAGSAMAPLETGEAELSGGFPVSPLPSL